MSLLLNPSTRYETAKSNTTRECQSLKALDRRDGGRLIITTQLSQADLTSKKCICVEIILKSACVFMIKQTLVGRLLRLQNLCLYATRSRTIYRQGVP